MTTEEFRILIDSCRQTDTEYPDTDGENADADGLTNLQELTLGTNSLSKDTDGDGLIDCDEVNTHGTDPKLKIL